VPSKDPAGRYRDILENIAAIEGYIAGFSAHALTRDAKTRDAVERCLARISEAAVRLGSRAEDDAPEIPWIDVRRLGNHLRHAYDRINPDLIWEIATADLPAMKMACAKALEKLGR